MSINNFDHFPSFIVAFSLFFYKLIGVSADLTSTSGVF